MSEYLYLLWFQFSNSLPRVTLSPEEIAREGQAVRDLGFEHVLLVSGEAPKSVGVDYFKEALCILGPYFAQVSLEVQPLLQAEYEELIAFGLHSVLVYQETYNREQYRTHHPKGRKSNFAFRLETPERLGSAGIHKIGIGALLGLEDWRTDSWFTALHLAYLRKRFWRTKFSISFPRLRPAEGLVEPRTVMNESELLQLICAYRLFDENVEISLSTRESAFFRDHVMTLGVTSMSAGSKTDPGGYAVRRNALQQFSTSDERSPSEVAKSIEARGYEPVWKDWDLSLMGVEQSVYSTAPAVNKNGAVSSESVVRTSDGEPIDVAL
ncbi:MAG: 2-iminoacetate synthase ThiH [Bdellovibrionales bacterium]|nr:2-iminoacetate synthase ThiH [Bdellovibrionales bacterium]